MLYSCLSKSSPTPQIPVPMRYFHVDAFAQKPFTGNPAGVCPLDNWPTASLMQQIAAENNLAETAFIVPRTEAAAEYDIRWFTPAVEIDLCGHATLASAHVLFTHLGFAGNQVTFHSQSGPLRVTREVGGRLTLDFPSRPPQELLAHPTGLADGLRATPLHVLAARDLLVVFNTEAEVLALRPDYARIAALEYVGVIATAPGRDGIDFVSRFFAPRVGVPEDPVTGSAHSTLIPYWAEKLGKTELRARQVSPRGGDLWCRLRGDRVDISGYAVTYAAGELLVEA
jgi:PhzF family phenazine biosynthesis protein